MFWGPQCHTRGYCSISPKKRVAWNLRGALLGDVKGTKHEMAELLAQKFPAELAARMPRKRRAWENEDGRMDMFDAVGLAVVFLDEK
jgi:hypothetical protein